MWHCSRSVLDECTANERMIHGALKTFWMCILSRISMRMEDDAGGMEYKSVLQMEHRVYCSIYGVVIGWTSGKRSRGSDYVMTVDVADEDMQKLSVRIFSRTEMFAEGLCVGDVIRIRNVKLYAEGKAIVGKKNEVDVVYRRSRQADEDPGQNVMNLVDAFEKCRRGFVKQRMISEIEAGHRFDFCGELSDKRREMHNLVILQFVDYSHEACSRDVCRHTNCMVLVVKAWGEFSHAAEQCEIGSYYLIKNLKADEVGEFAVASLSESSNGNISKIDKQAPAGLDIEYRRNEYQRKVVFGCNRGSERQSDALMRMSSGNECVSKPGVHIIKAQIRICALLTNNTISVCKNCGAVEESTVEKQMQSCMNHNVEQVRIARVIAWNGYVEIKAVCRGSIAEKMIGNATLGIKGQVYECVILNVEENNRLVSHIISIR